MASFKTISLLPSLLLLGLAVCSATAETTCQSFSPVLSSYFDRGGNHTTPFTGLNPILTRNVTYRLSPGVSCNADSHATDGVCAPDYCDPGQTTANATLTLPAWTNFTDLNFAKDASEADRSALAALYDVVKAAVGSSWALDATFTAQGDEARAQCLADSNSGFWVFSPSLHCVQGSFSGCSGAEDGLIDLKDGQPVEMCAPFTQSGELYGLTQFYFTTEASRFPNPDLKPVPISTDGSMGGGVRGDGHATEVDRGCVDQIYGYGPNDRVIGGRLCPVSQW